MSCKGLSLVPLLVNVDTASLDDEILKHKTITDETGYGIWSMTTTGFEPSLAKWLSVRLRTKWLWVRIPLLSLRLQTWRLLRATSSLTFRQTIECR